MSHTKKDKLSVQYAVIQAKQLFEQSISRLQEVSVAFRRCTIIHFNYSSILEVCFLEGIFSTLHLFSRVLRIYKTDKLGPGNGNERPLVTLGQISNIL